MESLRETLAEKEETVNSIKRNKNTVNSITVTDQVNLLIGSYGLEEESIARVLAEDLGDQKSLGYFRLLANEHGGPRLYEALSITKLAARDGKIDRKKVHYFLGILRKWGLKTKFRENSRA